MQQRPDPQVVERDIGEKVVEQEKPKSLAPLQSAPPVAPQQPKGDIVIRSGYDPKTQRKAKVVQGDVEFLISPLTGMILKVISYHESALEFSATKPSK